MNVPAMVRQSLWTLWQNRMRSALTVLGVVIGIAAVIALVGLSAGLQQQVNDRLSGLDATRLTVSSADPERATAERQPGGPGAGPGRFAFEASEPALTEADYESIAALPDVSAASPQISMQTDVTLKADAQTATQYQVLGVDTDYAQLSDLSATDGTWLTADQVAGSDSVVVLGADAASELFEAAEPVGESLWIGGEEYTVTGVLDPVAAADEPGRPGGVDLDGQVYTPYLTAMAATDAETMSTIVLDAVSEDVVPDLQAEIDTLLADSHAIADDANPDYSVSSNQDLLDTIQSTNTAFTTTLTGIAAISLLVGGIGIMNIMLMTVTERTREIGLRRAIGAKRRHVLTQFLTEAVTLTTLGGIVGLGVGYLLGGQAGQSLSLGGRPGGAVVDPVFEPTTAVLAVAVAAAVGIVFGIVPAVRAAQLDPATALRYE